MKRSKKMIALLCALVLVCGGYYLLQNQNKETATASEQTGSYALNDKTADNITGITWSTGDAAWDFVKTDDTWMKADAAAFPVNQTALDTIADTLGSLTAVRKITDVTSPGDYGMSEPRQTVSVTYDDGSSMTLKEGSATPFSDGYYLQASGQDDVVYTIADTLTDGLSLSLSDLAVQEAIQLPDNPSHAAIGSTFDVTQADTSGTWKETASGLAADTAKVESVLADISALEWSTLETATATEDELDAFGLTDAAATVVTVENSDTTWQLYLGATTDSGDSYARLSGSQMVYTISSSAVQALLDARTEDMWPDAVIVAALDSVQTLTLTTDSTTYTITPEHPAQEAANTTEESAENVTLASDKDNDLWTRLSALQASARAAEDHAVGERLLTITLTTTADVTVEIEVRAYDVDSYAVRQTGYPDVLVSAGDVDTILRVLRSE